MTLLANKAVPVPKGWNIVPTGQIYKIVGGGTPSTSVDDYWNGNIPWITSADIQGLKDIRHRKFVTQKGVQNSTTTLVPQGSIIVVTRVGLGKIGLAKQDICFSQDCQGLICNNSIVFPDYALYFLSTAVQSFKYESRGTTISGVTKKQLTELPFKLPPLPEQKRIVAKIEELFTRLDAGVEGLKKVKAELKRYRQAVLKCAFEGKLTADWRKKNKDKLEPASKLLERIAKEREKQTKGKAKKPPMLDKSELPEVPEGWEWARLADITDMSSGKAFKKKEYAIKGVRLFQIANVSFGNTLWENIAYLPESYLETQSKLALRVGNVIMALNRPILNGELKICVLRKDDVPAILYQRVGRFDFYADKVSPFFFYYARSPLFLKQLRISLQGVDQPFVNKPKLLSIIIPLTSLVEQLAIVQEIERHFSITDEVEQTIEKSLKEADRLRQSILKKAFEGKLVPQDPADLPAAELLKQIIEEKRKREKSPQSRQVKAKHK